MLDYRGTKNPLGIRNNNPGNLRPGHDWQGMVGENKGFVVFETILYGLRALAMDLINKNLRGLDTVRKVIQVYAPPSENNTGAYIKSVCSFIGCKPDDSIKLTRTMLIFFIQAIVAHENGPDTASKLISVENIKDAINLMPDKLKTRLK